MISANDRFSPHVALQSICNYAVVSCPSVWLSDVGLNFFANNYLKISLASLLLGVKESPICSKGTIMKFQVEWNEVDNMHGSAHIHNLRHSRSYLQRWRQ